MYRYKRLPWALKLVINIVILAAAFAAGMGIYAIVAKIGYDVAWQNLINAISSIGGNKA